MSMLPFLSKNLEQNSWEIVVIAIKMAIIEWVMVAIVIVIDINESIVVAVLSDHPQILLFYFWKKTKHFTQRKVKRDLTKITRQKIFSVSYEDLLEES